MGDLARWVEVVNGKVRGMRAEILRLERVALGHRTDFERERARAEKLVEELLQMTALAMHAETEKTQLESEIAALRSRNWWRRLAG